MRLAWSRWYISATIRSSYVPIVIRSIWKAEINVDYAPSHQSAVYALNFEKQAPTYLIFNTRNGELKAEGNAVSGFQFIDRKTKIYLYAETDQQPVKTLAVTAEGSEAGKSAVEGKNVAIALAYGDGVKQVGVRYGVSLISAEQAKKNLEREIAAYDVNVVAKSGRNTWNEALGKIQVKGGTEDEKAVFYTSFYRCYERPICLTRWPVLQRLDGQVHEEAVSFLPPTNWIWILIVRLTLTLLW